MKKLLIASLLSFFSQVPAFAVWIGHEEDLDIRYVKVYFTQAKPDVDNINLERKKKRDVKIYIENLYNLNKYDVNVEFFDVINNSQIELIRSILENFDHNNGDLWVEPHDNAEKSIKQTCEQLSKKSRLKDIKRENNRLKRISEYRSEEEQKKREIREQKYEDFAESQGANDAIYMESMGYFSSDDDY